MPKPRKHRMTCIHCGQAKPVLVPLGEETIHALICPSCVEKLHRQVHMYQVLNQQAERVQETSHQ